MPPPLLHLAIAATAWVLLHVAVAGSPLRGALVRLLGRRYSGLFSLLSVVGFVALAVTYGRAAVPGVNYDLWPVQAWKLWAPFVLMPIALVLFACAVSTKSPTSVGGEGLLTDPEPARGVLRITRHPLLCAFALWALTHLIANGDVAMTLVAASTLIVAVAGMASIDRKRAAADPEGWSRFAAVTSRLPFAAIAGGRNRLVFAEIGVGRLALGLALWGGMLAVHGWLYGASAIPW